MPRQPKKPLVSGWSASTDAFKRLTSPIDAGLKDWLEAAHAARYNMRRLAHYACLSERQLRRRFKALGYEKPKRFLSELQARRAGLAIKNGVSIKEVALLFHYSHPPHLHRALKSHLGVTPSEIRAVDGGVSIPVKGA